MWYRVPARFPSDAAGYSKVYSGCLPPTITTRSRKHYRQRIRLIYLSPVGCIHWPCPIRSGLTLGWFYVDIECLSSHALLFAARFAVRFNGFVCVYDARWMRSFAQLQNIICSWLSARKNTKQRTHTQPIHRHRIASLPPAHAPTMYFYTYSININSTQPQR